MANSDFKILLSGLIMLLFCSIATVVAGFYSGFQAEKDITLTVMAAMFVYPSPYLLLLVLGGAIYHTKRWRPIAHTFNLGSFAMLITWAYHLFVKDRPEVEDGSALGQILLGNFYYAAGLFVALLIVLIIEANLAWPSAQ
ncbi:MAG: hypothetical protein OEZ43_03165 [Gammaproteobacteria bacterium]|nr:hypothetical protein [Gammaproteobacteria bacterium]